MEREAFICIPKNMRRDMVAAEEWNNTMLIFTISKLAMQMNQHQMIGAMIAAQRKNYSIGDP